MPTNAPNNGIIPADGKPPRRDPLLCSRRDAGAALNLSLRTIDTLIAKGDLKTVRVGRRRLIQQDKLKEFIRARSA